MGCSSSVVGRGARRRTRVKLGQQRYGHSRGEALRCWPSAESFTRVKTFDEFESIGVAHLRHHDANGRTRLLSGCRRGPAHRHDDINLEPDEFGREAWELSSLPPATQIGDVLLFGVAKCGECPSQFWRRAAIGGSRVSRQKTDTPFLALLRLRGSRPYR